MNNRFQYNRGSKPLLISMPHNSSEIPSEVAASMNIDAQESPDTDCFVDRLYDFAIEMGAHTLKPKWSRFYIDLNRDLAGNDLYPGADNTELCPTTDFASQPIYLAGQQPDQQQIDKRIEQAWLPYHQCLEDVLSGMIDEHGYAILFDAHSIRSHVPRFFKGQLPDFNFGTADGSSCDQSLLSTIENLNYSSWSRVSNGRFKGGYITRHYGDPDNNIHALQLELSQATYMDEGLMSWNSEQANKVKIQLQTIIQTILDWNPL